MHRSGKAGERALALFASALLILLAGTVARVHAAMAAAHPRNVSHPAHRPRPDAALPPAPLDRPDPAFGFRTALWSGTAKSVQSRITVRLSAVAIPISFPTKRVFDPSLAIGRVALARAGAAGQALETVRRIYDGSRVVAVATLGERVVRAPRAEIVDVGARLPEVSRGDFLGRVVRRLTMVATAYWADPAWSNGRTASGLPARYGVVAVDPRVIPLGTRLYIPGYGYAVAADTGGAIIGDRIDLCFDTGQQAIDFGWQTVTVYVLST